MVGCIEKNTKYFTCKYSSVYARLAVRRTGITHPHAGLQADLGHDGPERDSLAQRGALAVGRAPGDGRPLLLGTQDALGVGGLREIHRTALIRC